MNLKLLVFEHFSMAPRSSHYWADTKKAGQDFLPGF